MTEQYYEKLLNIKTAGKQNLDEATLYYNRYEPTRYEDLKKLFEEYKIKSSDDIVDFGCGKGRLNFYLNYFYKCNVTGIEMNNYLYKQCLNNKKSYLKNYNENGEKIEFVCTLAEKYPIKEKQNKFYFFNPFSIEIFMKVIDNIIDSVYENNREVEIILLYPSDDYIFFLENYTLFTLEKEVRLENFKNDVRDRFMVYKLCLYK